MTKALSVATFVIGVSVIGYAQPVQEPAAGSSGAAGGDVEQQLIALDQKCSAASRKGDTAVIAGCFTDDFVGISADAVVGTKADLMKPVTPPPAASGPAPADEPPVYKVRMYGDAAVVTHVTKGSPAGVAVLHTFVKQQGQWKIASSASASEPEASLNRAGYDLLRTGKQDDAIDTFKLNVRLYPGSWNTYDSLGEAYAAAGQKDLAIQNYEKSVQLNPKNDNGKEALARLKAK